MYKNQYKYICIYLYVCVYVGNYEWLEVSYFLDVEGFLDPGRWFLHLKVIGKFISKIIIIQCMPRRAFGEFTSAVCDTIYTTGDFMKKVLTATCALRDR